MTDIYKYRLRPGYGSDKLLLEFVSGVENENFVQDLFDAIKQINPKINGELDLWVNDEVHYTVSSDVGQFILSKDIWNLAFILSNDNQNSISEINDLLVLDKRFNMDQVDFNNYKNASC